MISGLFQLFMHSPHRPSWHVCVSTSHLPSVCVIHGVHESTHTATAEDSLWRQLALVAAIFPGDLASPHCMSLPLLASNCSSGILQCMQVTHLLNLGEVKFIDNLPYNIQKLKIRIVSVCSKGQQAIYAHSYSPVKAAGD